MRFAGNNEPGSNAGVFTGQPGFLSPVRIDATSEMLSAIVRNFGCVAIWIRIAESGGGFGGRPLRTESGCTVEPDGVAAATVGFARAAESRAGAACLAGGPSDFAPQPAAARPKKSPTVVRAMVMMRCGQCNGCTGQFLV